MNGEDRWRRLMWSVQALALPAETQLSLFPHGVCVADELALDFEECWGAVRDDAHSLLDDAQVEGMEALDSYIGGVSGPLFQSVWDDSGLEERSEWDEIRKRATRALTLMGWELEIPPRDRSIYIV